MVKATKCPHLRWEGKLLLTQFNPGELTDIVAVLESASIRCPACNTSGSFDKDFYLKLASALKLKAKNLPK